MNRLQIEHNPLSLRAGRRKAPQLPGIGVTVGLAAVAALLGTRFPVVGGPVFGIFLGMVVKSTGRVHRTFESGIRFSAKQLLQYSIILLGTGLSMHDIATAGAGSLVVMLGTLATCLTAAWLFGRLFRISADLTTLIGVGTAICGASAIAAVSPVIDAEEEDVAYALSTIFLFNVAAVLIFPSFGRWLGLGQEAFGMWAGTAINDTSSVVAAGYAYGEEAGAFATIVKLTRSTLIIPIALTLASLKMVRARRAGGAGQKVSIVRIIPWFIVGFLGTASLNTFGLLPSAVVEWATTVAKFLIVIALTAVGLSADFGRMAKTGLRPVALGFVLWVVIAGTSLIIQHWTGGLL